MRCLNEPIAQQTNKEDDCTGRFREGRYKSQALFDEKALVTCLAYFDLNHVRARMVETPEKSEFTSISDRVTELKRSTSLADNDHTGQPTHLHPFVGNPRDEMPKGLPFRLTDYIELLDWTGRAILANKGGFMINDKPSMLERLQIDPKHWFLCLDYLEWASALSLYPCKSVIRFSVHSNKRLQNINNCTSAVDCSRCTG